LAISEVNRTVKGHLPPGWPSWTPLALIAVFGVLALGATSLVALAFTGDDRVGAVAKVVEAVQEASTRAPEREPEPEPEPEPPAEIQERITKMFEGRRRRQRRQVAQQLKEHEPADEVPVYARLAAELELSTSCRDRRDAIAAIVQHGDRRAVPPLTRIDEAPRRGCGWFRRSDCHACVRQEVQDALKALEESKLD